MDFFDVVVILMMRWFDIVVIKSRGCASWLKLDVHSPKGDKEFGRGKANQGNALQNTVQQLRLG